MGDARAEVTGGVLGREEEPSESESNFNISACEYDAPTTLEDLPEDCRSVEGRLRQNGDDDRSELPGNLKSAPQRRRKQTPQSANKRSVEEVRTDLDHLL